MTESAVAGCRPRDQKRGVSGQPSPLATIAAQQEIGGYPQPCPLKTSQPDFSRHGVICQLRIAYYVLRITYCASPCGIRNTQYVIERSARQSRAPLTAVGASKLILKSTWRRYLS